MRKIPSIFQLHKQCYYFFLILCRRFLGNYSIDFKYFLTDDKWSEFYMFLKKMQPSVFIIRSEPPRSVFYRQTLCEYLCLFYLYCIYWSELLQSVNKFQAEVAATSSGRHLGRSQNLFVNRTYCKKHTLFVNVKDNFHSGAWRKYQIYPWNLWRNRANVKEGWSRFRSNSIFLF